jgi:hypothetical protein
VGTKRMHYVVRLSTVRRVQPVSIGIAKQLQADRKGESLHPRPRFPVPAASPFPAPRPRFQSPASPWNPRSEGPSWSYRVCTTCSLRYNCG